MIEKENLPFSSYSTVMIRAMIDEGNFEYLMESIRIPFQNLKREAQEKKGYGLTRVRTNCNDTKAGSARHCPSSDPPPSILSTPVVRISRLNKPPADINPTSKLYVQSLADRPPVDQQGLHLRPSRRGLPIDRTALPSRLRNQFDLENSVLVYTHAQLNQKRLMVGRFNDPRYNKVGNSVHKSETNVTMAPRSVKLNDKTGRNWVPTKGAARSLLNHEERKTKRPKKSSTNFFFSPRSWFNLSPPGGGAAIRKIVYKGGPSDCSLGSWNFADDVEPASITSNWNTVPGRWGETSKTFSVLWKSKAALTKEMRANKSVKKLNCWSSGDGGSSPERRTLCRDASFYGSSYIALPLQEARSTTDLSFRFRTSRPDALLFLAAGRTDYCLVVLQAAALKVRINLGAGEAEVATPRGLRLDDLAWHDVRIHRKDADFTLTVDGLHSSKLKLPGRFYELNIHYGLFVGGLGDFREIFLGLWDNFRGCLNDLQYNGVDVLTKVKDRDKTIAGGASSTSTAVVQQQQQQQTDGNAAAAFAVSWDCSAEFDATSEKDMSFLSADSYVSFGGTGIAKTGSTLRFQLKTQSRDCVLLYSSGPPAKPDFAAVELVEGHLRVSLDAGGGSAVDLFSDQAVNDGLWHQVELRLAAGTVELKIDGKSSSSSSSNVRDSGFLTSSPSNKYLELSGQIYLGGVEAARHARALIQGVRTANSSLRGCIRRLELDGRLLGLRDARVTRHVAADCQWHYPCTSINPSPCVDGAQCSQDGLDHFRCECPQQPCTKPEFINYKAAVTSSSTSVIYTGTASGNSPDTQPPVLNLSPVQVTEGGSMTLTSRHLQVQLDYEKFGVRESGVMFHVVRPPQYGRLFSTLWRRADEATFTLLDVHSDRVRYVHDGSETLRDSALLELELAPRQGFLLPAYLQKRQRFVLHLSVSPVNDPPELSLSPGKAVLRLVKHTRKALTPDLLAAFDPDNQPKDLLYSVLNSKSDGDMEGSIENKMQSGVAISSFTQEDVNQGRIWYVHRGSPNGRLALRVSDGAESGPTAVLRIAAFDLQLFLANNTGLLVPVNGSAALTAANLTFSTNAPDQELDIRYDITRPPQHGQIQAWRSGRWQSINWFNSGQLQRAERIRYVHLPTGFQPPASQDDFQFSVSVALEVAEVFRSPIMYQFRFQLLDAVLREENNRGLAMTGGSTQSVAIGSAQLKFVVEPQSSAEEEVVYTLLDPPLYGSLWIQSQSSPLDTGSKWSQSLLNSQRLHYRLARRTLSSLGDGFTFRVTSSSGLASSDLHRFEINYAPGNDTPTTAAVTIGELLVNEGETAVLQASLLGFSLPMAINYSVLEKPRHGQLNLLDVGKRSVMRKNISWFGSDDLTDQRIVYTHDDSESITDQFLFLARPRLAPDDPSKDFQYVGTFPVRAHMKNDNPPVRVGDQVLRVVTNGERRLSPDILRYIDPDVETSPASIVYSPRGVPNGAFYLTDRPDVQLISSYQGVLATQPPRLRLVLSQAPQRGFVSVSGRRVDLGSEMTAEEIASGQVEYQHDHSDTLEDWIGLTVLLQRPEKGSDRPDILLYNGTLRVNILPVNDQIFQLLTKAPAMTVVERQWRAITAEVLLTEDADTSAKDLIYDVIQAPQFGKLALTAENATTLAIAGTTIGPPLVRFSQDDVNRGRVVFLHDGTMDPRSTFFIFRVSDGHFKADSGVFSIHFEPLTLRFVNHSVIGIQQGQSTAIVVNSSMGAESNGQRRHIFYNVTKEPENGKLYINDFPVTTFGQSNIDKEELLYVQTNMTASFDWFQVTVWNMAVVLERQMFNVSVIPLLASNPSAGKRPIRAIAGEKTAITLAMLDAGRLATLTNSNPTFTIIRKPRYGKIRKIVPSSSGSGMNRLVKRQSGNGGGNKEKDTYVFSHEDVQSQFIFYVARKMDNLNETHVMDSCEYRLTAPNVQPAMGVVEFLLLPSGSAGSTLVAASKNSIDVIQGQQTPNHNFANPRHPSSPDIVTENTLAGLGLGVMTNDIFLIVGIVCGILGLGLVILITIKCRMKPPMHKHPKNDQNNPTAGDMQLYRLSGTLK
ncbi:hypothetical protein DAPPUDRAFT_249084, partial [Daphnia pulex]